MNNIGVLLNKIDKLGLEASTNNILSREQAETPTSVVGTIMGNKVIQNVSASSPLNDSSFLEDGINTSDEAVSIDKSSPTIKTIQTTPSSSSSTTSTTNSSVSSSLSSSPSRTSSLTASTNAIIPASVVTPSTNSTVQSKPVNTLAVLSTGSLNYEHSVVFDFGAISNEASNQIVKSNKNIF